MVKKIQETKAAKTAKATRSSSKEKKKWSASKAKETNRRAVCIDNELLAKIRKEIVNMNYVTKSIVSERYGLCLSLSKNLLEMFCGENLIAPVLFNSIVKVYGKVVKKEKIETPKVVEGEAWA
ncbi:ribosomal protein S25 [Hamiltosporidium magnivora]|uniref:40S ribosomal protein S25 n=1 Tax=Hamiltosporidium magnivora TaxID=148818 RepID=A0A4Q9KYH0_9MICR|nr:ribosomal protein S25 [Hamiltosporidium magnivora]